MTKFIHISVENETITKQTFIKPDFLIYNAHRNTLNPPEKTLFLSIMNERNTSDWYEYCLQHESEYSDFVKGTPNVFDIDIGANIIVLNNSDDLCKFFEKYGNYRKSLSVHSRSHSILTRSENGIDGEINKVIEIIESINNYIDSLSQKKKEFIENTEKIIELAQARRSFKLPDIDIKNKMNIFTMKESKRDNNFIVDVFRLLKEKYDILAELSFIKRKFYKFELESINYEQIKNDGYNGIYYSKELFNNVDNIKPIMSKKFYRNHDIVKNNGIVNKITNCDLFGIDDDLFELDNEIIDYIKWLLTDTLMLWNIDNVIIE